MAATNPVQVQLLILPREIRDQIIGEVLFPEEKQPRDLTKHPMDCLDYSPSNPSIRYR